MGADEFLQYLGLGLVTLAISMVLIWFMKFSKIPEETPDGQAQGRQQRGGVGNRRAAQVRNRRGRRVGE